MLRSRPRRDEFRLALAVPRWTWRFYLRHLPLIAGLSLIPAVQRLVVVNWEEQVPAGLAAASEVAVMAVRLALVAMVWRLARARTRPRWANARAFATAHWPSLVCQGALLSVAFLVFDVVAEQVIGGLLPESVRQTYLGGAAVREEPTVVALTLVWCVGLIRQALHHESTARPRTRPPIAGPVRGR